MLTDNIQELLLLERQFNTLKDKMIKYETKLENINDQIEIEYSKMAEIDVLSGIDIKDENAVNNKIKEINESIENKKEEAMRTIKDSFDIINEIES